MPILLATAYSMIQYAPLSLRLMYLTGYRVRFFTGYKASLFCLGLNNIFPARLGEVAKALYLRQKNGIPLGQGLGMIFWERFFDLNALLVLGILSALILGYKLAVAPLAVIVGGIWVCVIVFRFFPATAELFVRLIPIERLRLLVSEVINQLQHQMRLKLLLILAGYTVLVWFGFTSAFFVILHFVANLGLTPAQILTVFVITGLGFAVPSSPGGLGVYEAAFVFALELFGHDKPEALAVAILARLVGFVPPIVFSLLILAESGLSLKSIRAKGGEEL